MVPPARFSLYVAGVKFRRSGLLSLLFVVATWLLAAPAIAAGPDAAARALGKKAMEEDYLATEFDKAQEKLNKALTSCGDKCTPQTRALLHRDLGVVFIGGLNNKDKGTASFVEALKLDPTVALDPDVKTKEIEAAFEAAKKKAGGAAAAGAGGGTGPKAGGSSPSGDFEHTPAIEQQVRTPVPIYAEYTGSENIVKVMARYKGFGMTEYKPLELKKVGKGWGGNVPCADVGQQGTLQYYLQGFNDQNDPVATGGDRNNPYKVAIKTSAPADPPHLPDQPVPTQCADTGDCPPGFPCAKKADGTTPAPEEPTGKPEGEDCDEGNECQSGKCKSHKCTAPESKSEYSKVWIGVGAGIDFVFLPSGDDVCKLDPNTALPQDRSGSGYYCTTTDGADYPNRPPLSGAQNESLDTGKSGKVNSGIAPGNVRVWLSADYGVTPNILIGVRLGLVTSTYPGKAAGEDGKTLLAPVHVEARFTYLIGKMALAQKFAPMAFAAVGASEWDAKVEVPVTERGANPSNRTVQAWATGGPAFVSIGGGIRFAPVPRRFAIMFAPLKLNLAFGGATSILPSLSPELGVQVGF